MSVMEDVDRLETRCSTAIAAKYLGCTRRHVEAMIQRGALTAWDIRAPGAKRARFVVAVSSVRVLLADRHINTRTKDAPTLETQACSAGCRR